MPSRTKRSRPGFTLVELMVVVLIMGIITVTVMPAMDNLRIIREGAARDDLVRMIEVVKGRSVASGIPHGLRIGLGDSSLTIVVINISGKVEVEFDPLTNGTRTINLGSLYPGVSVSSMTNGDGVGGSGILWFDYESNPHTRNPDGSFATLNTSTASVVLSSNARVMIYPYSGVVEVQ